MHLPHSCELTGSAWVLPKDLRTFDRITNGAVMAAVRDALEADNGTAYRPWIHVGEDGDGPIVLDVLVERGPRGVVVAWTTHAA